MNYPDLSIDYESFQKLNNIKCPICNSILKFYRSSKSLACENTYPFKIKNQIPKISEYTIFYNPWDSQIECIISIYCIDNILYEIINTVINKGFYIEFFKSKHFIRDEKIAEFRLDQPLIFGAETKESLLEKIKLYSVFK